MPFGYRVKDGALVKEPGEQKAIATMKRLRQNGKSLRVIAERVTERLGRAVSHMTVKRVLNEKD